MFKKLSVLIPVAVLSVVLTGCYESVSFTIHSPGSYKGPTDPLVAVSKSSEHQQRLLKRLQATQMDR
ncbi:MAG: hypothetical protein HUJ30_02555 [Gammaproteobacteria bacterium]|nr:hypothetical protein [Gammaproteobacteria bacterium]